MDYLLKLQETTLKLKSLLEHQNKVIENMIDPSPPTDTPPSPPLDSDYQIIGKDDYTYLSSLHDDIPDLYLDEEDIEPKPKDFRRMNAKSLEETKDKANSPPDPAFNLGDRVRVIKLLDGKPKSAYHRGIIKELDQDNKVLLQTKSFGSFWIPVDHLVKEFSNPKQLNVMDYVIISDRISKQFVSIHMDIKLVGQIVPPTNYYDMLSNKLWNHVWVDIGDRTIQIPKSYLSRLEEDEVIENYIKEEKEVVGYLEHLEEGLILKTFKIIRRHYDGSLDVILLDDGIKLYYYPRTKLHLYP